MLGGIEFMKIEIAIDKILQAMKERGVPMKQSNRQNGAATPKYLTNIKRITNPRFREECLQTCAKNIGYATKQVKSQGSSIAPL